MNTTQGEYPMKATTVRIDNDMLGRLDDLAKSLSRSRSWVINQAIGRFIEYEEWFVQEVKDGMNEVARGDIAAHEEVIDKFKKWGIDAG